MNYNPDKHRRRSIRLKDYDYSQEGLYFITCCVKDRLRLFGTIKNGEMRLNPAGQMVEKCWLDISNHFSEIELYEYIIMPNHFHGIIRRGNPCSCPIRINEKGKHKALPQQFPERLGDIIGAFKSISTNEYIRGVKQHNWEQFNIKLWQRNYYEHIIRNQKSYENIAKYILENPLKWTENKYYYL